MILEKKAEKNQVTLREHDKC